MRRRIPEINAGSMADIAFLLLIFFLVTTTMDTDKGILKRLSPILPEEQEPPEIRERNIFVVLVNRDNQLLVEGNPTDIQRLRNKAREFILNPYNLDNLPEKKKVYVKSIGEVVVSKGVISIQTDRGTSYKMYITVMNELMAALNEVKNEASFTYFQKPFDELEKEQKETIEDVVPVVISEADPRKVGA